MCQACRGEASRARAPFTPPIASRVTEREQRRACIPKNHAGIAGLGKEVTTMTNDKDTVEQRLKGIEARLTVLEADSKKLDRLVYKLFKRLPREQQPVEQAEQAA
jgi:Tfp pilus assembly protein PilN